MFIVIVTQHQAQAECFMLIHVILSRGLWSRHTTILIYRCPNPGSAYNLSLVIEPPPSCLSSICTQTVWPWSWHLSHFTAGLYVLKSLESVMLKRVGSICCRISQGFQHTVIFGNLQEDDKVSYPFQHIVSCKLLFTMGDLLRLVFSWVEISCQIKCNTHLNWSFRWSMTNILI